MQSPRYVLMSTDVRNWVNNAPVYWSFLRYEWVQLSKATLYPEDIVNSYLISFIESRVGCSATWIKMPDGVYSRSQNGVL